MTCVVTVTEGRRLLGVLMDHIRELNLEIYSVAPTKVRGDMAALIWLLRRCSMEMPACHSRAPNLRELNPEMDL